MTNLTLYHGSQNIIEKPKFGLGKPYNDYGQGFYCTEQQELAREWACTEDNDGYVNKYEIDVDQLNILNLSSDEYSILHWLAILITYRRLNLSTPIMKRGAEWLRNNFFVDLDGYDAIIGYRADDSYFSFARAFLANGISLQQLDFAMRLGKLGEQFVLKSEKAFDIINFISSECVESKKYFPLRRERDEDARNAYRAELEKNDVDGLYIRDLIREGVTADDPRL